MALFVGRLSFDATSRDLEDHFKRFGPIDKCEIKRGRGFGFVMFHDRRDAEDALYDLNGSDLMGCRITVEWAKGPGAGGPRACLFLQTVPSPFTIYFIFITLLCSSGAAQLAPATACRI
eukprot:TRINITY_DN4041_c0_g1_i1.p3 TRINITY_DN4041_c0_g1~~TRINITY_DN4041_c0_g1_i1.p3  ORF type:complete len:119 (-),score=13.31 TRINITY_DN4041_c0_g1_i1:536-892(-)